MINYLPPKYREYHDYIDYLFPELRQQGKTIKQVTFQVTEDCCLACTYCYQIHKTHNKMPFEIAKQFLDKLFQGEYSDITEDNTAGIILDFIGGEPFLEIDLISQICDYFIQLCIQYNSSWLQYSRINLCSNGILYFEPKVQDFLQRYGHMVGLSISIDGNKALHDACRIDFNGQGSYDRAIAAVHHYYKTYHQMPNVKMTLAPENVAYTYDAILNLIKENYTVIHFNCVFEKGWTLEHATILYNELKKLANYLLENNLYNKINLSMFTENRYVPLEDTEENNNNWCGIKDTTNMIAIDYKGDIYHCIRFMESSLNNEMPPLSIGTVKHGFRVTEQEQINYNNLHNLTRRSQSPKECMECPIATGCSWCSGYNYQHFHDLNHRATYICCMHQAASLANVYYWNSLYQKLNIDKIFELYLPKEKALQIISQEEYDLLKNLATKKGE